MTATTSYPPHRYQPAYLGGYQPRDHSGYKQVVEATRTLTEWVERLVTESGNVPIEARLEYVRLRGQVAEAIEEHAQDLDRTGFAAAAAQRRAEAAEYREWAQRQRAVVPKRTRRSGSGAGSGAAGSSARTRVATSATSSDED